MILAIVTTSVTIKATVTVDQFSWISGKCKKKFRNFKKCCAFIIYLDIVVVLLSRQ